MRREPDEFTTGDSVWVRRAFTTGENPKLQPLHDHGIIIERKGLNTYEVELPGRKRKKRMVVNASKIKHRADDNYNFKQQYKETGKKQVHFKDPQEEPVDPAQPAQMPQLNLPSGPFNLTLPTTRSGDWTRDTTTQEPEPQPTPRMEPNTAARTTPPTGGKHPSPWTKDSFPFATTRGGGNRGIRSGPTPAVTNQPTGGRFPRRGGRGTGGRPTGRGHTTIPPTTAPPCAAILAPTAGTSETRSSGEALEVTLKVSENTGIQAPARTGVGGGQEPDIQGETGSHAGQGGLRTDRRRRLRAAGHPQAGHISRQLRGYRPQTHRRRMDRIPGMGERRSATTTPTATVPTTSGTSTRTTTTTPPSRAAGPHASTTENGKELTGTAMAQLATKATPPTGGRTPPRP